MNSLVIILKAYPISEVCTIYVAARSRNDPFCSGITIVNREAVTLRYYVCVKWYIST